MVENADKSSGSPQPQEVFSVAHSIAGGVICIALACIAIWNEMQRFQRPIGLGDMPLIAGRQVAAIAVFFVGAFLIWNACRAPKRN